MELTLAQPRALFDVLGDRLRLRVACCLLTVKEGLCVCELVDALQVSQPNASRHLKLMKAADLVEEQREGRWVYSEVGFRAPKTTVTPRHLLILATTPPRQGL